MKRLLAVLFILVLMPSLARALPPSLANQNETYHNCYGTYTDTDGTKYVGAWRNGKQHGQGTVFHADGRVHPEGIFENGKFKYAQKVSTTPNKSSQYCRGSRPEYEGSLTTLDAILESEWATAAQKEAAAKAKDEIQQERWRLCRRRTQSPATFPLDKAEKKCAELGFTKGTEKYGDCVMKLLN